MPATAAREAEVLPDAAQGLGYGDEPRIRIERHGPEHGVDDDEDHRLHAEPEPQERQRHQRDGGERIEHGGERLEHVGAEPRRHGDGGEDKGQGGADGHAREQYLERLHGIARHLPIGSYSRVET